MKPVAAMVATAVLVIAGLLGPFGGTGAAAAAAHPAIERVPGVSLRLDLTDMSPRLVTAAGPDTLTITGTLVNTGDQPIEQLAARVQRSNPLTTEGAIRDALDGNTATDAVTPQFQPVADRLAPGDSVAVRMSVPLRGAPTAGLALAQTGVHEILVNVNGAPVGGQRARVAAVRVLLPVQSLPPDGASDRVGTAAIAATVPFSMLYPISERPHRISTVPGQRTLLDDDSLAASFAAGGRLEGLVAAIEREAPPNSPVRAATCLAIDPDLVETAAVMRDGYDVRGPDGVAVRPGAGADAARSWLDRLTAIARSGCVLALPFADADLVALTRGGLAGAATSAVTDGREVLAEVLQIPTALEPVTWPADGAVDEPTLTAIGRAGDRTVVLSADAVEQGRSRLTTGVATIAGTDRTAVLTDPLLTASARAPQPASAGTGTGEAAATTSPTGTRSPVATQDAIGALAFRVLSTPRVGTATNGPMVLAPPRLWSAEGAGAGALLATVGQLMEQGGLVPRGLLEVVRAGQDGGGAATEMALDYPVAAGGREITGSVVDGIRRAGASLADLVTAAGEPDPGSVGVGPEEAFTPVRRGLVRPASAALRGSPRDADNVAAIGSGRIEELRSLVSVVQPPIPFSLGTSDAPLPLTIVNGLPVPVRVRVEVSPTSGLQVAPIAEQRIPPQGRRQLSVNAKVTRSGQFTVDARVITPGGGQLGPASRLKVVSTAYGTITVWLTATAGVLLVALVARRVVRRRNDPDHPRGPELPPGPQPGPPPAPPPAPPPGPPPGPPPDPLDPRPVPATDRLPVRPPPVPVDLVPTDPFHPRAGPAGGPADPRDPSRTPTRER